MSARALTVLVPAAVAAVAVALVAPGRADQRPVLHEDLRASRGPRPSPAMIGSGDAGKNPAAVTAGDKLLPEPDAESPSDKEPVFGRAGLGTDRFTEHKPNNQTGAENTLHYVEVFNPSVVPFKRMSSLDGVRDDYTLYTATPALSDLAIGGAPRPGFDRFWGSLQIELEPGLDVAIPSVAPDMRILSYETTPRTSLTFSRDGADNYYVRNDESGARGVYRLVFLVEADPRHFAPEVPRDLRITDIDQTLVRPLPARVQVMADRALRELKLDRGTRLTRALDVLVTYFREFEPGERPADTGDIYWDLFRSKRGVCRHRAFVFMVTANALGIPSRFLGNEAHAWVEVYLPTQGWARIDLGGAAAQLDVENAEDKTMYQPRAADPFPKPKEYAENYTRLTGDVRGLSDAQLAEARTPRPRDPATGGGSGGSGEPGAGIDPGAPPSRDPGAPVGPGPGLPAVDPDVDVDKQETRIRVSSATASGFRGEAIQIAGVVQGGGRGIAGLRVELYLARKGTAGADARVVGHTASGPDGRFVADVILPRDLELDDYEVFAATPGDTTWKLSVSK